MRINYKEFRTTSVHTTIYCDKPGEEYIEVRDKDNNFLRTDDKEGYIMVEDKNGSYILIKDYTIEIHASEVKQYASGNKARKYLHRA